MIWYTEELPCKDQPEGTRLVFSGIYNQPGSGKTVIILKLDIEEDSGSPITKILMEKNPSMLVCEDPNEDDIQRKYYRQVLRFRDKITQTPFNEIIGW
jgi:hypothetical protein